MDIVKISCSEYTTCTTCAACLALREALPELIELAIICADIAFEENASLSLNDLKTILNKDVC